MTDKKILLEIYKEVGEIKGTQDMILKKIDKICTECDNRKQKMNEIEEMVSKHSTYFRIIYGALTSIVVITAAAVAKLIELFGWKHG